MTEKNKEILATSTPEGETSFMVCKTEGSQKVCTDMESGGQSKMESENMGEGSKQVAEKGMLDNNVYNIVEQLAVEHKSLWRIKNNYKNDASKDNEMRQIWDVVEKDKEEHVKLLTERLKERL